MRQCVSLCKRKKVCPCAKEKVYMITSPSIFVESRPVKNCNIDNSARQNRQTVDVQILGLLEQVLKCLSQVTCNFVRSEPYRMSDSSASRNLPCLHLDLLALLVLLLLFFSPGSRFCLILDFKLTSNSLRFHTECGTLRRVWHTLLIPWSDFLKKRPKKQDCCLFF